MSIPVHFNLIEDAENQIFGKLPKRAEDLSVGYDVFNAGPDLTFTHLEHKLIPLGFKTFFAPAYWLFLVPRSSTHAKKKMHTLYGVIDCSYEGLWYFSAQYVPPMDNWGETLTIKRNEAVAQVIVMPRYEMDIKQISSEDYFTLTKERGAIRGEGGFGSSDQKKE